MTCNTYTILCSTGKQKAGFGLVVLIIMFSLFAQNLFADSLKDCMIKAMGSADSSTTVGQLHEKCQQEIEAGLMTTPLPEKGDLSAVEKRLKQDKKNILQPFTLMAHKPNYILPVAYNHSGYDPTAYQQQFNDPSATIDNTEVQFQLSIKVPLLINMFDKNTDLYVAYTNHSLWQLYNNSSSSPFRETNHEPEAWLQFHPDWNMLGFTNTVTNLGIVHQSNGRGGELSRGWNRLYANFVLEREKFVLSFKPWHHLGEDDHDDETDYLGHYELRAAYKRDGHVFQIMSRNNLESGFSKGAVELSWSFPLWDYPYLKGYIQYFSGYGESLIDYNHYVNRIGIGLALTDWL